MQPNIVQETVFCSATTIDLVLSPFGVGTSEQMIEIVVQIETERIQSRYSFRLDHLGHSSAIRIRYLLSPGRFARTLELHLQEIIDEIQIKCVLKTVFTKDTIVRYIAVAKTISFSEVTSRCEAKKYETIWCSLPGILI